ncbi:leucyl aminopeptidase [Candidatus Uhrbacteria bacterium]|nr:leucyl aminopeptidase [Candidatus Uhrbacteria bacterium]
MNHTYSLSKHIISCPVIAVFADHTGVHPFLSRLSARDRAYGSAALNRFKAGWLECEKLTFPSGTASHALLVGLGEKKQWNRRRFCLAARKIVQQIKNIKQKACAVLLDDLSLPGTPLSECAEIFAQNAEMAQYAYRAYLKKPKEGWGDVEQIQYATRGVAGGRVLQRALDLGAVIGQHINEARELANTPGGDMTPTVLARYARQQGRKYGIRVTVLGEAQMKKLGMGAILGVSRGSSEEAKLIVLEYHGASSKKKPIVFVGKGITFDSGGLNLKPTGALEEMHMDMSGGAAVISSLVALARMKARAHVIGIIPAVENMPSGSSYRPGDILRAMSGTTIEITNTDAEGRVVLADALTYAKKFSPSLVVDIATLTGACAVALGPHAAGVFSRDEDLVGRLCQYGEQSGDYLWPLPLWEEYEEELKGTVADIRNAKKTRDGGATNGALFLHAFAKDFPAWAHIDIAPTMTTIPSQGLSGGSRGAGTALLIRIARQEK